MGHSLPCPTGKRLAQRITKFEKLVTAAKNKLVSARIYRAGMERELRRLQRLQKRQAT